MAARRRRKPAAGPSLFDADRSDLDVVPPPLADAPPLQSDQDQSNPDIRMPQDRQQAIVCGDVLRAAGKAVEICWLPAPQERASLPPMPGRREDGVLWFESH